MAFAIVTVSHAAASPAQLGLVTGAVRRDREGLMREVTAIPGVREAVAVATCNRAELYLDIDESAAGEEGALAQAAASLSRLAGTAAPNRCLVGPDAVLHLFRVACGLDSVAVGEPQIAGQLRAAIRIARETGTAGGALQRVFDEACRVSRSVRGSSGLDRTAPDLLRTALADAPAGLPVASRRRVVVVGAGSVAAMSVAQVRRAGVERITVVGRTLTRAAALAGRYGVQAAPAADLGREIRRADLLITCAGARPRMVSGAAVAHRQAARAGAPLHVVDLGFPPDVETWVRILPGVRLTSLESLRRMMRSPGAAGAAAVAEAEARVLGEVHRHLQETSARRMGPVIGAMRQRADGIVLEEVQRALHRLPTGTDPAAERVLSLAMHRLAGRLLHEPTVALRATACGEPPTVRPHTGTPTAPGAATAGAAGP